MLAHAVHGPPAGPPVLLIHSLAMDRSMWDGVVSELEPHARIVACDLPGHGESRPVSEVTIEEMADDVAELLRAFDLGPVTLAGLSLGGCVGQVVAVRYPELVSGLGLLSTTCWYGPAGARRWRDRAQLAVDKGLDSLAEVQLARWFTPAFATRRPEVARRLLGILAANRLECYVATCQAMGAFDFRDEVSRIDVPTAVLVGEQDTATPPDHARDLHDRIDGSVLTVLPECGHLSAVERAGEAAELIAALVPDLGPR